jgi:hypothetical protein
MRRNFLFEPCVLASMEKIPKTELYQRGIPLLAFLPILALLSERAAAAREPSEEWEFDSHASAGERPVVER